MRLASDTVTWQNCPGSSQPCRQMSEDTAVLRRIAQLGIAAPRRVVGIAVLLMIVIGAFGTTVADKLSPSGFQDPNAESSRVAKLLTEK